MKLDITLIFVSYLVSFTKAVGTFECTSSSSGIETDLSESAQNKCIEKYSDCSCQQIETRCTFGPDLANEFLRDEAVKDSQAESCDRDFCTCTSHDDYQEVLKQRLSEEGVIIREEEEGATI